MTMTIRFEISGATRDDVIERAREHLRGFLGEDESLIASISYDVEPLIEQQQGGVVRWTATVVAEVLEPSPKSFGMETTPGGRLGGEVR
jgi:hypothetical protein